MNSAKEFARFDSYLTNKSYLCNSFAQYVVIGDKMRKGQQEFVERNGAEGNATVIRRDPRYTDNKALPEVHSGILGDRILK